jgi:ABC-type bacteriocin/lantibiotic exporter with double-glycine peptidase domain
MPKRPTLLPVKPFRQTASYCGPAVLKQIFDFYGVTASEAAIARAAGASRRVGTPPAALVRAAQGYGFRASYKTDATFAEIGRWLRRGVPVIVDWFSVDDGHYSVAVGLDRRNIYLQDPELGRLRAIDRATFDRIWFDFTDVMHSPRDLRLRGLLVVQPGQSPKQE